MVKSFTMDTGMLSDADLALWVLEPNDTFYTSDHLPIISDFVLSSSPTEPNDVMGCTYPAATNFNSEATLDDGSCDFVECNYETAYNDGYEQGLIDGAISSECPGDFNSDSSVTTQDLLQFLTFFGFQCP